MDADYLARFTVAQFSPREAQALLDEDLENWFQDMVAREAVYDQAVHEQMEMLTLAERADLQTLWAYWKTLFVWER